MRRVWHWLGRESCALHDAKPLVGALPTLVTHNKLNIALFVVYITNIIVERYVYFHNIANPALYNSCQWLHYLVTSARLNLSVTSEHRSSQII